MTGIWGSGRGISSGGVLELLRHSLPGFSLQTHKSRLLSGTKAPKTVHVRLQIEMGTLWKVEKAWSLSLLCLKTVCGGLTVTD